MLVVMVMGMVMSREVMMMMLMVIHMDRDIQQNMVIKCLETCNVVFSGGGRREQTYIIRNMIGEAKEAQAANVSVLKM